MKRWRVGVDVGGTFTDLVAVDELTGEVRHAKGLSTPSEPARGTLDLVDAADIPVRDVWIVVHGTTIVINTLVERTGARTGLITTRGFRDVLEIRHGGRTAICTPFLENPRPFISRELRQELRESVWCDGNVEATVEPDEVARIVEDFGRRGVESIAVCLLNSYANPVNERTVGEMLQKRTRPFSLTLSSDVAPIIGEYERFSTTMINAYVRPRVEEELQLVERGLTERGIQGGLYVMQSNGGIVEATEAGRRPVTIVESGPAGGVTGSLAVGRASGQDNLITFDMGGTTSKASLIEAGKPRIVAEFELLGRTQSPGSGWPLAVPMMDIPEVGLGGGSIAWLSMEGALHVGPRSAGASPGPASYGRGGDQPTLTDANVALGLLDTLLGGQMQLDRSAAREAISKVISQRLGRSVEEMAGGIRAVAVAQTANLVREVSVARGLDPRDFTLIAYGGAGPMHACDLAGELGMSEVIIPVSPGTFSALGLVYTDLRIDVATTHIARTGDLRAGQVDGILEDLEDRAWAALKRQGFEAEVVIQPAIDMRYVGQAHQIAVSLPSWVAGTEPLSAGIESIVRQFHENHHRLFGHSFPEEDVEFVVFRASGVGAFRRPALQRAASENPGRRGPETHRTILLRHGEESAPVFARANLRPGIELVGPLLVEEYSSITLVPPHSSLTVDDHGNLLVRLDRDTD